MTLKEYQGIKSSSADAVENSQVTALLAQAALSHATELARMGRYDDAAQALGAVSGHATPPVLDLIARIRAQQGRLAEAQALWGEAAQLDPNNESYRAALQRLARMNRYSPWVCVGRWLVGVVLAALIIGALALAVNRWGQRQRLALVTEIHTASQSVRAASVPEIRFQLEGVSERVEDGDAVLRFDSGLFKVADMLTPEAKTLLEAVGHKLQPVASKFAISVVGYSDDLPITTPVHFHDNRFLALARADVVARFLATSSGIPEREFTLQSAKGSLYPNDSPENRAKNRSVEIWISAKRN